MQKPNAYRPGLKAFFQREGLALLCLAASFLYCFKDWAHLTSKVFLSLDSTVLYYPLSVWVQDHLLQGHLPLLSDLLYHGAPVAATSMAGVFSPFLWMIHFLFSGALLQNLLFLFPFALYLFGAYALGRELSLSRSASLLLAFLWTYNGHQMAQLDHQNVAWAHAFFPWAWLALLRFQAEKKPFWLLLASLFWGLCLFSGHPQVVFLEGLFFVFWALLYPEGSLLRRFSSLIGMTLGTLLFTAPMTLFTATYLSSDKWSDLDRFFHSWTPANFLTLLFPWFFGRDQYDRYNSDYWWQYQFVEMQVAFSIVGLFFILWFFLSKRKERLWLSLIVLFGLSMALGKFFLVYPLVQSQPLFSFFRDPARYWFLLTWALGLGAAYAWDDWFKKESSEGRRLSTTLLAFGVLSVAVGWAFIHFGQSMIQTTASWFIQHYLLGDSLHTKSLSEYLTRLPEKLNAISANLDFHSPRVWGPLLFMLLLNLVVWNKRHWGYSTQKVLLLLLVFVDLMAFRMPLGNAFYSLKDIPSPALPASQGRALPLISRNNSPLPSQYGEYAFPNMNLISHRAVLPFDANPSLNRYNTLLAQLGWFAWVYQDRDLLGFTHHPHLLSALGVEQIVSDTSMTLPKSFKTLQNHLPYVYRTPGFQPKAWMAGQYEVASWPGSLETLETVDPTRVVLLETDPGFTSATTTRSFQAPEIKLWSETHLSLRTQALEPSLLVLQKTYLPGWKASVNGKAITPQTADGVLTALPLSAGENQVELTFEPLSLRLGFFLFLVFLGAFLLSWGYFLLP